MCGIGGYVGFDEESLLERMCSIIAHRGPDDFGYYKKHKVGLGARRLSIIDVDGGHQPVHNEDQSIWVAYNGEIYNHSIIAGELIDRGHKFSSRADTEMIVHAYEEYGWDCIKKFNGMFVFAIYDEKEDKLFIARDRLGIRPLYYACFDGKLIFSSEVKAILESDSIQRAPNLSAIDDYVTLRYVPGPKTMFEGIYKLPAGYCMTFHKGVLKVEQYWEPSLYTGGYENDDEYYMEGFAEHFRNSVSRRLMSDVPLGAYLSGGIDSSVIVATMSKLVDMPVKVFSVGFNSPIDEIDEARETAKYLGCDFHEISCMPKDLELLPEIIWHMDEPLGDAHIIPTYLLSKEACKYVKVVLIGEGADETLAGYPFHKLMKLGNYYDTITPDFVNRYLTVPLIEKIPISLLNHFFSFPAYLGNKGKAKAINYLKNLTKAGIGDNYKLLISLFDESDKTHLYSGMMRQDFSPDIMGTRFLHYNGNSSVPFMEKLLNLQYKYWLQDNILLRQDKMAMAHSIETRVPFLDHQLVEFLLKTPPRLKLRYLTDKYLERRYAESLLPADNTKRKKKPFYMPLEYYLDQSEFKKLVEMTLTEEKVRKRGYFDYSYVKALLDSLNKKEFLYVKQIMALIILELWHLIFLDKEKIF